jgi:hypothetical protein
MKVLEGAIYESLQKDKRKVGQVLETVFNIVKKSRLYTDMTLNCKN